MHDVLRETPVYQEMTRWAREEGELKALLKLVQTRFPDPETEHLAQSQVSIIDDPEVLENLILKVGPAQTAEEVQRYLLDWRDSVEQED